MGGVYEVVGVCRHVPGCSCNGGFPGIRDLGVHDDDGDDDDGDWAGRVRILGKEEIEIKEEMVFILFLKDVKSVDAVTEFVKKKLKKRKKKKKEKRKIKFHSVQRVRVYNNSKGSLEALLF